MKNGRDILLNVLNNKDVERIPVSPFIYTNFINEYYGMEVDPVEKGIELYKKFGFDIILRTCNVWDYLDEAYCDSLNWSITKEKKTDSDGWSISTIIKTPEKQMTQTKKYKKVTKNETVEAIVEYYIKDENDFEQFVKFQPPLPEYDCTIIAKAREMIKDDGIVAPWAQGAFNAVSFYRKLDDLFIDPYVNPVFYNRMMLYFSERMLKTIYQFKKAGADMVCSSGNVANSTSVGPDFFEKHVLPYEIEFARKVKELNIYYLYHNCGDASSLLQYYSKIGMDIYESLTGEPYGDTVLEDAFSKIDKKITLCGNIDQIDFLKTALPDEIRKEVKRVLELAKKRGNFILATSDYISEGTSVENIEAFAKAGFEFGKY